MRFFTLTVILIFLPICTILGEPTLNSLFKELDEKIKHKDVYIELKNSRIENLKIEKRKLSSSPLLSYALNQSLYSEYKSYISDSAIFYLNENLKIAENLNDQSRINETSIALAYLFTSLGSYKEAIDIVAKVNPHLFDERQKVAYYSTSRYIYSGLTLYTQDMRNKDRYRKISHAYADTLLMIADKNSEEYLKIQEINLREKREINQALLVNDKRLALTKEGTPEFAYVAFHRALLYRFSENHDMEKRYLLLSAISDVKSAIKDNASITMLSDILMKEGDVDRAHYYVRYSLDNINDYNTRIRSSEILNIQAIIDKAYQQKNDEQKKTLSIFLIVISVLSVLLIISVCYVYKQMRKGIMISKHLKESNSKLNQLNRKLSEMNKKLSDINSDAVEANKVKEEYIGYFLSECLNYIDKLDSFRKMANSKIKDNKIDELYKSTRNNELKDNELRELFTNFDTIFLHLFPNFIEKFNSLLLDEERIVLKKGEILNTELRIYALIRLGINDSNTIANFLGYSVNTIYNYRAKMKNKAKIAREDFEVAARRIGTFSRA
ncbi:DUF6377 domain-containing protein [Dysgonomonas macrotermitis]|uniref:DUF6377 domain-containing protein n=1 Tax=Dysgonomonas macrotermitis TaxID=1346286 RepID=A0A1M4XCI3_9BACT|nr:DUF6377 domain-containing protein [Dysgonomonas macrotermitis]SHE90932.1 hypothetical protein SAMN05444362_102467 [Dysgonomonas macrotermitis]